MLHIDIPSIHQLNALAAHRAEGSVSIYLETGVLHDEAERARIELKNARDEAIAQLEAAGSHKVQIEELAEVLDHLIDDQQFWNHQSQSLAIFVTADHIETYRLPNQLPAQVTVADRFLLKPLLRSVTFPHSAFVLALSANAVRVIEVSANEQAFEVTVDGMPKDAASYAGKASLGDRSHSGRVHGDEGLKLRLTQYARAIDQALRPIASRHTEPLILAAAQPLEGIYRQVNSYRHLADTAIAGNPEELSPNQLAELARPILDGIYAAKVAGVREAFAEFGNQGRALSDVADVANAATAGAVDTLLFDFEGVVPGRISESGTVEFDEALDGSNYGVIDEIVRRALATGAQVLAVRADELPTDSPVAAILRYAI